MVTAHLMVIASTAKLRLQHSAAGPRPVSRAPHVASRWRGLHACNTRVAAAAKAYRPAGCCSAGTAAPTPPQPPPPAAHTAARCGDRPAPPPGSAPAFRRPTPAAADTSGNSAAQVERSSQTPPPLLPSHSEVAT
ncbi:glutaconyl-CoA decarboxylase subunit gamma-like [Schistocerca nitens]|uniref:glutaconyl-CoA decarboxylase subunit gamma-like n=1 Tax=Schistocerca nitens TaxID=7011 RepID=UPI0021185C1E|nr:glutaconyl-CoA decarboxylase subunit gamma-like [Schistocerca nitens]